ncbi:ATP-binding protein [Desulfogranum mediterraneum]|uniref:ATP-binding protein n=1 Tax=Desulfogranum mediterraneum TaxID=160661 RepID=UPI0003F4F208|nr:ATP-binding protein [Desulfogranum mediterraneum]
MKLTIQYKLFLCMLAAALAVVAYMAVVIQWSFDRGFLEYIDTQEQEHLQRLLVELESYYKEKQSWQGLKDNPLELLQLHAHTLPESLKRERIIAMLKEGKLPDWLLSPSPQSSKEPPRHPLMRLIILDQNQRLIFGRRQGTEPPHLIPLQYRNRQVGAVGLYSPRSFSEDHQLLFVRQQKLALLLVGLAAIFITIGLSLPLAYHLTKPIRSLSQAARKLISGDFSPRLKPGSKDELGQLSHDFNRLAETLAFNETQRKLWISDIAHELRTPLTGLQGEIEAVQDGIRQADEQTLARLHQGVMRLRRLVEDLNDLSRSELGLVSYFREEMDLGRLLLDELETQQHAAAKVGLELKLVSSPAPLVVVGDGQRLQQLIANLLINSLKFTDQGGLVEVTASHQPPWVEVRIEDSPPGVPGQALPKLFDHLYRVEASRNRAMGGAGLGLAICRQIVLAHEGSITAGHSPLGGLKITVRLPEAGEAS